MYPFPVAEILKFIFLDFNLCSVGVGKGAIFMFLIFVFFFQFRAKQQITFLPNKLNWKNIFIDNIYNTNIFQVAY